MSSRANVIAEELKRILLKEPYAKAVYRAALANKGGAFLSGDDKARLFHVIDEIMDTFDGEQLRIANRYRKKLGLPPKEPEPFRYQEGPKIAINTKRYGEDL